MSRTADTSGDDNGQRQDRELATLQGMILAERDRIGRLTGEKTALEARLVTLTRQIEEERAARKKAEARLAGIEASLSWKITAPLRRLARVLRRG